MMNNKMYFSLEIYDKFQKKFDMGNRRFTEGNRYTFEKKENNHTYSKDLKFLGYSRIDGLPIFEMEKPVTRPPLGTYSFKNNPITTITLITSLGDHLREYRHLDENKEKMFIFLMKHHGISEKDLMSEDITSSIIRDIRLNKVLG